MLLLSWWTNRNELLISAVAFSILLPNLDLTGCTHLLTERMRFKAKTDQTVKQEKEAKMQKTVINAAGRNSLVHVVAKADLGVPGELIRLRTKK